MTTNKPPERPYIIGRIAPSNGGIKLIGITDQTLWVEPGWEETVDEPLWRRWRTRQGAAAWMHKKHITGMRVINLPRLLDKDATHGRKKRDRKGTKAKNRKHRKSPPRHLQRRRNDRQAA